MICVRGGKAAARVVEVAAAVRAAQRPGFTLWALVIAGVSALAWAIAGQLDAPTVAKAATAGLAAAAAGAARLAESWYGREALRKARERTLYENVRFWTLPHGSLPRVADVDPTRVGAAPCVTSDPTVPAAAVSTYVPRPEDAELRRTMAERPFVLVVGGSRAGKSRTAFEAARAVFPERRLLVPVKPRSLETVLTLNPPLDAGELVIWLDEFDKYLTDDGVTLNDLDALATREPPATIVATLRSHDRDRCVRVSSARALLANAASVRLKPLDDSGRVLDAFGALHPRFKRRVEQFGLGASLVAGPELVDRLEDATNAVGAAAVRAAADWARTGIGRPLEAELLKRLYPNYLRQGIRRDASTFADGLSWALEEIYPSVSLLVADNDDRSYRASDFVVDYLESKGAPVVRETWESALAAAGSADVLLAVGVSAYARSETDVAETAFGRAAAEGEDEGAINLSLLLEAEGRHEEAERVLETVPAPTTRPLNFALLAQDVADFVVIHVRGELDIYTSPELKEELLIQLQRDVNIVLDFTAVTFMDSTCLGVLVGTVKRMRQTGKRFALASSDRNLTKIFEITGLDRVFAIRDTVEEAMQAAEAPPTV